MICCSLVMIIHTYTHTYTHTYCPLDLSGITRVSWYQKDCLQCFDAIRCVAGRASGL